MVVGAGLHNLRVGRRQRRLELREHLLGLVDLRAKEPLERVEREVLDGRHREGAGAFAGAVAAHAVCHQEHVCPFLADLDARPLQACLPDAHGLGELGGEELVLVGRAHFPFVGNAKRLDQSSSLVCCGGSVVIRAATGIDGDVLAGELVEAMSIACHDSQRRVVSNGTVEQDALVRSRAIARPPSTLAGSRRIESARIARFREDAAHFTAETRTA